VNAATPWIAPVELPATPMPQAIGEPSLVSAPPVELPAPPGVEKKEPDLLFSEQPADPHPWQGDRLGQWLHGRTLIWFVLGGLLWLVGFWTESAYHFLWRQFQQHWLLGTIFSFLVVVTLTAAAMLILGELRGMAGLHRFDDLRSEFKRVWEGHAHGQGMALALKLHRHLAGESWLQPAWRQFHDQVQDHHDDKALLELLSRTVHAQLDHRCYPLIVQHGTTTALASTISPFVWLDSLIFLWQNLRMIRAIAACYGLSHPGRMASLFLAREVMLGLLMAGTTDLVVDKVTEAVGGHAASLVLAQVGKGAANALFTARVGLAAMHRCRTLPFHPGGEPSLERVRQELFKNMKREVDPVAWTVARGS